jgi:predicted negative regulator of RcsB-dependent stress response
MSTMPPNQPAEKPNRPGDPAEKTDVQPPFEEQLRAVWEKKENRTAVFAGCAIVVVMILGWYAYKAFAAQREAEIESVYSAAVTPARLRAFARDNAGHPLAGVAHLKLADEAYTAGNYSEAIGNYDKAAAALSGTPFASRALFGKAICQIRSGKSVEGTTLLLQLAEDAVQLKALRCEAAYHLASLAFDAGNFDDVNKFTDLVMQVDASGVWAQRSLMLRARIPVTAAAPVPAPQKPGQPAPAVSPQLPGS